MRKYTKYKPSGIAWLGKIPEHWDKKRLKYFLSKNDGGVWGDDYDGIPENATKVFRSTEINIDGSWHFDEEPALRVLSDHEKEKALLKEGDLLVTKSSGSQLHIGKTALVTKEIEEQNCCYSNFMQRLRPLNIEASKFLHIFLNSNLARDQYNYLSNSTTGLANLSAGLINDVLLPCQRPIEQTAMANFLDEKTTQIDKLITNKKRLIELLKEERTAIINRAVTCGINPNVKLKPSGIEWLGDIPKHWEVKKLKYVVSKVGSGITPRGGANVYQNDGIPLLRSQNIYNDGLRLDDVVYISEEIDNEMSNSRINDNDVLLNITGASIGRCFYVPDGFGKGNVNQHVCIIRPIKHKILTSYLHVLLISGYGQSLIDYSQNGANREGLNFQEIKSFNLPLPKIEEQLKIIQNSAIETKRIDATIFKIENEIELMQEYRTALISEVVTGKIKVI